MIQITLIIVSIISIFIVVGTTTAFYIQNNKNDTKFQQIADKTNYANKYEYDKNIVQELTLQEMQRVFGKNIVDLTVTDKQLATQIGETDARLTKTSQEIDTRLTKTSQEIDTRFKSYMTSDDITKNYATKTDNKSVNDQITVINGKLVSTADNITNINKDLTTLKNTVTPTLITDINKSIATLSTTLNDYAKKTDLSTYASKSDLGNYTTKSDLGNYATKSDLGTYAKASDLGTYAKASDLGTYAKQSDTKTSLDTITTNLTALKTLVDSIAATYVKTADLKVTTTSGTTTTTSGTTTTSSVDINTLNAALKAIQSNLDVMNNSLTTFKTDVPNTYATKTSLDAINKSLTDQINALKTTITTDNMTVNKSFTTKGGTSEHNPNNAQTHFPWSGDNKNYIRGDTEIRGNTNNIGDISVGRNLGVAGSAWVGGDIITSGKNNWIIHTPDDGRRTMHIAPSKTEGQWDWDWANNITLNNADGSVNANKMNSKDVNVSGRIDVRNKIGVSAAGIETIDNADWMRIFGSTTNGIALHNGVSINQAGGLNVGEWAKVPQGNIKASGDVNIGGKLCVGSTCVDQGTFNKGTATGGGNYANGTPLNFANDGTGITWGNNFSKIYDNGHLNIDTDDNMYMKAPNILSLKQANNNTINFTPGWQGTPDGANNVSEIANDTGGYKTLMIVGNKSAGAERRVGIWDKLDVNGNLSVSGDIATNGKNNWIIHTPDDGRRTMHIAPSKTEGQQDWDWANQTILNNADGSITTNRINVNGPITSPGFGIQQANGDGWWNSITKNGDKVIMNTTEDLKSQAVAKNGITLAPWNGVGGMRVHGAGVDINGELNAKTVNISNKWKLGDTGDEWLRLNKIGSIGSDNYYGGLAADKLWTRNFLNASDQKLKENIVPLSKTDTDNLSQLNPKSYQFISDKDKTKRYGFIAQDVEKVYPNLVSTGVNGEKGLNYMDIIPLTVAGIQKINKQVKEDRLCIDDVCLTKADLIKLKSL